LIDGEISDFLVNCFNYVGYLVTEDGYCENI